MTIKKCKECGNDVSTKAESCPHCGAKQKRTSIGCVGAIFIIFVFGFVGFQINNISENRTKYRQAAKQQIVKKQKEIEAQTEKKIFVENIEKHYTELVKFFNQKQFDNASNRMDLFKKYYKTNYKDVDNYDRELRTRALSMKVKKLPASDAEGNFNIYKKLLELNPQNETYKKKVAHYRKKWEKYKKEKRKQEYIASCQLELLNTNWSVKYEHATYEGQIKNISNIKLKNVQAVVTWYDKNGNMITSRSSLIEYNPIMPGQTSPFKVIKSFNPVMKTARVDFSYLMGGTIRTYKK